MNRLTIQFAADKTLAPAASLLRQWVKRTLKGRVTDAEITLRIIDPAEMTELNATYRHKAYPTNVLSFPFAHDPLLGDIAICAEVVNREAKEQYKTADAHWAHMVVHGIFHLMGYDHGSDEEASIMETLEIEALQRLGFANPYHHETPETPHE